MFASAPKPPLLPATSALPSHKRIPVIPLERQSLIIPPSLSDETRKLAPYRNSFPGAKRGSQRGGVGMCRPHTRESPRPSQRAGPRRALPAYRGLRASPGAAHLGAGSTWAFAWRCVPVSGAVPGPPPRPAQPARPSAPLRAAGDRL